MNVRQNLAADHWEGSIDFTIESRDDDQVVATMPVADGIRNAFGTVHAGALIWFADVAATLCAVGDLNSIEDDGTGFPLAIDLHTVLTGNEKDGTLTATSVTTKRGKKLIIVRTEVRGQTGRLIIEMTTTHLRSV